MGGILTSCSVLVASGPSRLLLLPLLLPLLLLLLLPLLFPLLP